MTTLLHINMEDIVVNQATPAVVYKTS